MEATAKYYKQTSVQCKSRNMTQVCYVFKYIKFGTSEISHVVYLTNLKWSAQE